MTAFIDRHARLFAAAVAAIAFLCVAVDLVIRNHGQDLFIYRGGAALALSGRSPYDADGLREMVAGHFVEDEHAAFRDHHGFFLSPVGVAVFAPFAVLPWPAAVWLFAAGSYALVGLGCWHLLDFATPAARARYGNLGRVGLTAAVMWDPVLFIGMVVLQTSGAAFGLVVIGEVLRRRGSVWAGAVCWAAVFAKPHVALPLLALAWYAGGWRHFLRVGAATAALLCAGIAMSGGPKVVPEYVHHLQGAHKRVDFNKVSWNPQLTSWNRALYVLTDAEIELDATRTLAGYAVCAAFLGARVLRSGRPTPAWAFAAGTLAAMVSCQLIAYELMLAVFVLPLTLDWLAAGRAGRWPALWLGAGLAMKAVPYELVWWVYDHWTGTYLPAALTWPLLSVRTFGVLVLASGVAMWGWPRAAPKEPRA